MIKYDEVTDLSGILAEGFFADKVVNILAQRKHADPSDTEVLERILSFTEKVEEGQRQVDTGRLSGDAVESIGAYYRAIITLQALMRKTEEVTEEKLDKLIEKMRKEVKNTLRTKEIDPAKVESTRVFFSLIQRGTLKEVGKHYGSRIEVLTWPKRVF